MNALMLSLFIMASPADLEREAVEYTKAYYAGDYVKMNQFVRVHCIPWTAEALEQMKFWSSRAVGEIKFSEVESADGEIRVLTLIKRGESLFQGMFVFYWQEYKWRGALVYSIVPYEKIRDQEEHHGTVENYY